MLSDWPGSCNETPEDAPGRGAPLEAKARAAAGPWARPCFSGRLPHLPRERWAGAVSEHRNGAVSQLPPAPRPATPPPGPTTARQRAVLESAPGARPALPPQCGSLGCMGSNMGPHVSAVNEATLLSAFLHYASGASCALALSGEPPGLPGCPYRGTRRRWCSRWHGGVGGCLPGRGWALWGFPQSPPNSNSHSPTKEWWQPWFSWEETEAAFF